MALNELQWGRLLALAWIDEEFKNEFELNPLQAFEKLRDSETKITLSDDTLETLGIPPEGDIPIRLDVERTQWALDFSGASGQMLDDIIQSRMRVPLKEDIWRWNDQQEWATTSVSNKNSKPVLSIDDWARIYARLWLDVRIDEPEYEGFKKQYSDKKDYMQRLEQDPASVIEEMVQNEYLLKDIPYKKGDTRLFILVDKPDLWTSQQLHNCVATGFLGQYQLQYMPGKCC